jgi:hypothetical protein
MLDAIILLKVASIILAALFGFIGFATETWSKDTKTITTWGIIALTGIIFSLLVGFAQVFLEQGKSNSEEAATRNHQKIVLDDLRTAVDNLERILTPIGYFHEGRPGLNLTLELKCFEDTFKDFCNHAFDKAKTLNTTDLKNGTSDFIQPPAFRNENLAPIGVLPIIIKKESSLWEKWPFPAKPPSFTLMVNAARDDAKFADLERGVPGVVDLSMTYSSEYDAENSVAAVDAENKRIRIGIAFGGPTTGSENGVFYSIKDFSNTQIMLADWKNDISAFRIIEATFFAERNRQIKINPATIRDSKFKPVYGKPMRSVVYRFPDKLQ